MKIYSWDEWESMTDDEKQEVMRAAVSRNFPQRIIAQERFIEALGTDIDKWFLKSCGIDTEDL